MDLPTAHNQNISSNNPALYNNTEDKMRLTCDGKFSWSVYGPLIVVSVLIVALNSVEIALICWKETLRAVSHVILVSLAVSDLMSGLVGIPLIFGCSILISEKAGKLPPAVCVSSTLFMRFTAVSTVLHFLLVASDRYIMIMFSIRYQRLVTLPRVWSALVAVWLISLVMSIVQLAWYQPENMKEMKEEDTVYLFVLIVAFVAVPLLFLLFMYGRIILVTLRHLHALRVRRKNLGGDFFHTRSILRDLRGTVILVTMLIVFAICWLPFFLMILQQYINSQIIDPFSSWGLCFILFARFIPPLTNSLFCAFFKRDFRDAFQSWVRSRRASFVGFRGNLHKDTERHKRNVHESIM